MVIYVQSALFPSQEHVDEQHCESTNTNTNVIVRIMPVNKPCG